MKRLSASNIGSAIARQTKRYLGSGAGGITNSYPTWSFLTTIGSGVNAGAPGAPTGITTVGTNSIGDPRSTGGGYTNYRVGDASAIKNLLAPSSTDVGGSNISLGNSSPSNTLMLVVVAAVAVLGLFILFRKS